MSTTRRNLLKTVVAAPLAASAAKPSKLPNTSDASVYTRIGVKPVINGMGTVTVLGGSLMPPEVIRAMDEASNHFVLLPELQIKVGEKIAELVKVPGAMVSTGAAGCITMATAASMVRGDVKKLQLLPDAKENGIPFEVIQQKTHRSGYEHQMRICGAKIVTVETAAELEAAINPNTAMLFFLNKDDSKGQIKRAEFIQLGKKHNIPTFTDAAADVPPAGRLGQYVHDGFDLVAFSGGKGLWGPQSTGILLGRKDLTDCARMAQSPNGGIGRGMKVGKEELIGILAAVERYLKIDHEAETREMDRKISEIAAVMSKVKGVTCGRFVPEIANEVPHFEMKWDEPALKVSSKQVQDQLLGGDPAIYLGYGQGRVTVSVWLMRGNEHKIVARRLAEIFKA
jgi:L-seryl-tRNA(Ser) seleniumtransferase